MPKLRQQCMGSGAIRDTIEILQDFLQNPNFLCFGCRSDPQDPTKIVIPKTGMTLAFQDYRFVGLSVMS
jgi:hypothetical protein